MNRLHSLPLLSLLLIGAGCGKPNSPPPQQGLPQVTVSKPLVMPIVEWDEYTGRIEAIDYVEVRARVSGFLESTHFEEGRLVEKGDVLAIINPRPFQTALAQAQARLEEAKANAKESEAMVKQAKADKEEMKAQLTLADQRLDRLKQLSNSIAREELEEAISQQSRAQAAGNAADAKIESAQAAVATSKATISSAEAALHSAEIQLGYTTVRAKVSGRVGDRKVTEGNIISGGDSSSTLITTIVSIDPVYVYFDANEQEYLKYQRLAREGTRKSSRDTKNPILVALVNEQGFPHKGHMDFVDNQLDPNTGTMRGRGILSNDDGDLTPGLFAKVRLPGSGRFEAKLLPDSAIGSDQADRFVYVVKDDGSVERRNVELGTIAHGLRVINKGLDGNESIVIDGLQRIVPDIKVEAKQGKIEAKPSILPDNYEPVPESEWLTPKPDVLPEGIEKNVQRDPEMTPEPTPPVKQKDE